MTTKVSVLLEKPLHSRLKAKLRNVAQLSVVVSRLVEMYLNGEITVVLPEKKV